MIKICSRCVMDSSDDSITFDEYGHCNYCREALHRMPLEYFPSLEGQKKLDNIIAKVKSDCRELEFDCLVGVSGGVDSTYVVYLGYQYGLRMLCVHIDDGTDTEVAKENIQKVCAAAKAKLISVTPDMQQYKSLTKALFLAGVPNLAAAQDNILFRAISDISKKYGIKYSMSGANFSMESILQRNKDNVNASDSYHLKSIYRKFGEGSISELRFHTLFSSYIGSRYFSKTTTIYPLNYIDYRLDKVLDELYDFCGYTYYGGKHFESVLTRFLQCYYLPKFFNFDKRKSHFSSMIVSGQMTRDEALERLSHSAYPSDDMLKYDCRFLANYLSMDYEDFIDMLEKPKHNERDYPMSVLNYAAPIARKFRKYLG